MGYIYYLENAMNLKFMSTMTGTPVWSQGFELSSYSDVVNNAMHLYGSPTMGGDFLIDDTQLRLYPCLKFTCFGRIRKLVFAAPVATDEMVAVRWPIFGFWRRCTSNWCSWEEVQHFDQQPRLVYNTSNAIGVYELDLAETQFNNGYFIGVRQPQATEDDYIQENSILMNMLYQNGGGYCNAISSEAQYIGQTVYTRNSTVSSQVPLLLYIAIETGQICLHFLLYIIIISFLSKYYNVYIDESSRSCVKGFLNRQSLELIVDAPRDNTIFRFLNTTQGTFQSMPLSTSGDTLKCIIGTKFNHSDPSGWPILQIRRRGNVTAMTQLEPRPTGFLNVFEFETLSANIQPGDVVRILHNPESRGQRYLLAFVTVTESSKPLIYVNVSNNITIVSTPRDIATEGNEPVSSNDDTTTNIAISTTTLRRQPVVVITGGVFGTLVILSLMAVLIITVVLTYRCRGKTNSSTIPSTAEVNNTLQIHTHEKIEMDTNEAYITNNFPTEPNIAYGHVTSKGTMPQDYDYVVV